MRLHLLLIIGLAVGIAACAEKEQAAPEQASEAEPAAPEVASEAMPMQAEDWRNSTFMEHMHEHADHLDDLNFALDDGDLEGAMVAAYWLSRHETVSGLPENLQPYVVRMREAASDVEEANNLDTARAAARKIGTACQACHAETGVMAK